MEKAGTAQSWRYVYLIFANLEYGINIFQKTWNENWVIRDWHLPKDINWIFETFKLWNQETKKLRKRETKKPRNQETKQPRNHETKEPRNFETKKPINSETKNKETKKPTNQETYPYPSTYRLPPLHPTTLCGYSQKLLDHSWTRNFSYSGGIHIHTPISIWY